MVRCQTPQYYCPPATMVIISLKTECEILTDKLGGIRLPKIITSFEQAVEFCISKKGEKDRK